MSYFEKQLRTSKSFLKVKRPELSVFVLTYNQEEFIAQTLDSIINQQTNFDFEIVIGDDASVDETSIICEQYKQSYPHIIDYKRNKTNLGLIANFITTAARLKGKYVAICDGDDYWTDFNKLQKQVDFLEANEEYCIVGTNSLNLINGKLIRSRAMDSLQTFEFEEMALQNRVSAPTVLSRNFEGIKKLPSFFLEFPYGDWPVYLLVLHHYAGKVAVLPCHTAVYRRQIGVSATMRSDLPIVYAKNTLILEKLMQMDSMKGSLRSLQIGWSYQKKAQIAAFLKKESYIKSFEEFCVLISRNFHWTHLRWYLYALKKISF